MTPDYDRAAIAAMQLLIDHQITETPISPLPMLKNYPGCRVMSFTHMADEAHIERGDLVPLFGPRQDAATFRLTMGLENVEYVVVYNMRLPFEMICRGVARELGHIVLGHDGVTRPDEVRLAEAMCFAHHLLSPRPIIRMIQESPVPLTLSALTNTVGCAEECVEDMQHIPGARVPAGLNRQVREQFARCIQEYIRFHLASPVVDRSPRVDLVDFMGGYEE